MEFYVNEIISAAGTPYPEIQIMNMHYMPGRNVIGLFGSHGHDTDHTENGCYTNEYYTDTDLYAVGIQKDEGGIFDPEKPFTYGTRAVMFHLERIRISGIQYEQKFEAKSIAEAVERFRNHNW